MMNSILFHSFIRNEQLEINLLISQDSFEHFAKSDLKNYFNYLLNHAKS